MTDKEYLHRLQSIIDNMPDKEKLLEETLKRVDKMCEERNVKSFLDGTSYITASLLSEGGAKVGDICVFTPSIKASNV